jgi:hypothetical protein
MIKELIYDTISDYNFGDALNEPILNNIFSENYNILSVNLNNINKTKLSFIGSIAFLWKNNTVVWGSGVLHKNRTCKNNL